MPRPQQEAPPRPELLALLQAVVDNPDDDGPNLVLSDWLEEHDDPRRAELLRLHLRLRATCCEPDQHPERPSQQVRLVQLLAEGVQPCMPQRTVALGKGVAMTLAWIPPGIFLMGSPASEPGRQANETQHRVTLTKGFHLGVYPVTQTQWRAVMGNAPSKFKGPGRDLAGRWPVEMVSWDDGQEFCKKLSAKEGEPYRLPTEAEWEYACRAGTTTPFSFDETITTDQVNYNGNYPYSKGKEGQDRKQTTPVGTFPANAWGLCDMHGNVWEWCQDWYGEYPQHDSKDYQCDSNSEGRVVRGGSWYNSASWCRSAHRVWLAPDTRGGSTGLRVCVCLD